MARADIKCTDAELRQHARQVVDLLRVHCPEDQKLKLERIFREDSKGAIDGAQLLQWWTGRYYDGLAYGNWPWL